MLGMIVSLVPVLVTLQVFHARSDWEIVPVRVPSGNHDKLSVLFQLRLQVVLQVRLVHPLQLIFIEIVCHESLQLQENIIDHEFVKFTFWKALKVTTGAVLSNI